MKQLNQVAGMVHLLDVCIQNESNLCATFYKVTAVYEYLHQVVEDLQEDLQT